MRIVLKSIDLEVEIDDEKCDDRSMLESEALGCIESMLQSRLSLQVEPHQEDEEEERISPGQNPAGTDQQVRPVIALQGLYG